MAKVRILGLDPGTTSFAYSVQELTVTGNKANLNVLQRGFVKSTVYDLRSAGYLNAQIKAFRSCIKNLIDTFGVRFIIAERYQSRGMGGATIEHVNIMLGCLLTMPGVKVRILPASQWKNALNREGLDLKETYIYYKDVITPHEIDSGHIGWYGANMLSKGILSHVGVLEKIIASPQESIVAEADNYGLMDTVEIKKALSKEKHNKRKKRKKK